MTLDNFPTTRPSFTANFARSQQMPPQFTFSRASTGTYVGENGLIQTTTNNTPRFQWKDGKCQGLLIEESRINRCENSIPNTANGWAVTNAGLTANAVTAPDGTTTAATLIEDTSPGIHRTIIDSHQGQNGATYSSSVYVKAAGRTTLNLQEANGGQNIDVQLVDLAAGTITPQSGPSVGFIEPVGNGWYRVGFTYTMITFNGSVGMMVYLTDTPGNTDYTGDGTSGIHIWGGQHEEGNYPTSYIPTTGITATRSADVCEITGDDFTSFFNYGDHTTVFNWDRSNNVNSTSYVYRFQVAGNPNANSEFNESAGEQNGLTKAWRSAYGQFTSDGTSIGNRKGGIAVSDGEGGVAINGVLVSLSPLGSATGLTNVMTIGQSTGGSESLNGCIRSISYYPTRVSDEALEALTQ